MSRRSERVVIQPDQFMYLGESFEKILEGHEINPMDYDEAISDVDADLWQRTVETKLKSMFSSNPFSSKGYFGHFTFYIGFTN